MSANVWSSTNLVDWVRVGNLACYDDEIALTVERDETAPAIFSASKSKRRAAFARAVTAGLSLGRRGRVPKPDKQKGAGPARRNASPGRRFFPTTMQVTKLLVQIEIDRETHWVLGAAELAAKLERLIANTIMDATEGAVPGITVIEET